MKWVVGCIDGIEFGVCPKCGLTHSPMPNKCFKCDTKNPDWKEE